MLRVLFVSRTWPVPPRNGVELPISEYARRFSNMHKVDLAVWGDDCASSRAGAASAAISGKAYCLRTRTRNPVVRGLAEIAGIRPNYLAHDFLESDLEELISCGPYDAAWISPFGGLGLPLAYASMGLTLAKKIILGHNDCKSSAAWNGLLDVARGRAPFVWSTVGRGLRLPLTAMYESRLCDHADVICVQTQREADRLRFLLPSGIAERIVVLCNGGPDRKGAQVVSSAKPGSLNVLFMTHLSGGRRLESRWFLNNVWPSILHAEPRARLHIVGSPPTDPERFLRNRTGIVLRGFVPDLAATMSEMAVAVLPITHSSGVVNRVRDVVAAGVPLVSCRGPLLTIDGLIPGVHALAANESSEFAQAVIRLLQNRELRKRIGSAGELLAREFPTWETASFMAGALLD